MSADATLDRLAELARQIEAHQAAAYILEIERIELRAKLRAAGWIPPALPEKATAP